jgi:MoxR-like ATPase
MTMTPEQAGWFSDNFTRLVSNVETVLLGKTFVIRLGFTALFSEGHLLLEDFPGTGKTSFARAIAQSVDGSSNRVQFTPDLLPGDITGVSIYDQRSGEFARATSSSTEGRSSPTSCSPTRSTARAPRRRRRSSR